MSHHILASVGADIEDIGTRVLTVKEKRDENYTIDGKWIIRKTWKGEVAYEVNLGDLDFGIYEFTPTGYDRIYKFNDWEYPYLVVDPTLYNSNYCYIKCLSYPTPEEFVRWSAEDISGLKAYIDQCNDVPRVNRWKYGRKILPPEIGCLRVDKYGCMKLYGFVWEDKIDEFKSILREKGYMIFY